MGAGTEVEVEVDVKVEVKVVVEMKADVGWKCKCRWQRKRFPQGALVNFLSCISRNNVCGFGGNDNLLTAVR